MISDAEDHQAHGIMVETRTGQREGSGPAYENGFLDMACLQSASKVCKENITLHRCLRHTKELFVRNSFTADFFRWEGGDQKQVYLLWAGLISKYFANNSQTQNNFMIKRIFHDTQTYLKSFRFNGKQKSNVKK